MYFFRRARVLPAMAGACALIAAVTVVPMVLPGAPAGGQTAPLVGPLAASGASIVDQGAGGARVSLDGVDFMVTRDGPYTAPFVDAASISTLQGWGVHAIRLSLSSDAYLARCAGETYDPAYRNDIADAVDALTSAGIYVLLDVHASNPNCMWGGPQMSSVTALPGDDVLQTVSSLAAAYGGNRLVGFEPYNEPQGCTELSGTLAGQFVPSAAEPGRVCPTAQSAADAWSGAGTVHVQGRMVDGIYLGGKTYHAVGMLALYQAIMQNLPAGAPVPLVFLDANYFASDGSTFDTLPAAMQSASNLVEVFHPYDCQDTSSAGSGGYQNANCNDATPETCATIADRMHQYVVDPATNAPRTHPVDFDEFNFPAGENFYQAPVGPLHTFVPIKVYQHGYWVHNMLAAMQRAGAAGWSLFSMQNADVESWVGPYALVQDGIVASTPLPWPASDDMAPAVSAMQGQTLSCQDPPVGYG